jgi:hypothetical protein
MKKFTILLSIFVSINTAFCQKGNVDAMLKKIAAEKDDNIRIDLINAFSSNMAESDPVMDMQNFQKLLLQSQRNKDRIAEAMAFSETGYDYGAFGNYTKSLECNLKATAIAHETGNEKWFITKMRTFRYI